MPFILKNYQLTNTIKANEACLNVAKHMQTFQYLRNPTDIDKMVIDGYQIVLDAEYTYGEDYSFQNYIMPKNYRSNSAGYSVYDEVKYKNKSKFLKDFYTNSRPNY